MWRSRLWPLGADANILLSDFMIEPNPAWPTAAETTNILRFLHRFADLMSSGSNSQNLLCAARMLQAHIDLLKETEELLRVERAMGVANAEARKALEGRIGAFEIEILTLKSKLTEQQSWSEGVLAELERRIAESMRRAEQAEARLTVLNEIPPAIAFGSIAVPLSTLQVVRAQFASMARTFEKSGDIVSQAMCEAGALSLDRAILEAGGSDVAEARSQHAA